MWCQISTFVDGSVSVNRNLLIEDPTNVRLIVRSTKRTRGHQRLALPWKPYNGKLIPDGDTPSTTIFGDFVFCNYQDAMFAFLLWIYGGATGGLQYELCPNKRGRLPLVAIQHPQDIGVPMGTDARRLAIFLMPSEPSHTVLRRCAECLLENDAYGDGMILIGTLRPVKFVGQLPHQQIPQLRGVRLYRCRLPTCAQDLPDVLPNGAVEHGWFPCVRSPEDRSATVRLVFAFQSQAQGNEGQRMILSPALIPPLHTVGYRLWRRGQSTYALAPKGQAIADARWDSMVKQSLQERSSLTADSGTEECG